MKHAKTIEAIALGSALVVSISSAFVPSAVFGATATVCNNSTTGIGDSYAVDATSFAKTAFNPRCSPNTIVRVNDGGASFAAKGGSLKGNTIYGSTSEGGGGAVWCGSSTLPSITGASVVVPANSTDGCS